MPQPRLHEDHAARQAAYRGRQERARAAELSAKGLPHLPAIATMPGHARWTKAIEHATCLLTNVVEEMEAYCEDRSEAWREGERAAEHQERIDAVQEVLDALRSIDWM